MRRRALSAPCLLIATAFLAGCSGFNVFLADVHGWNWNPNRPIGDSENMRRVKGLDSDVAPLKPEEGNVWPGPAAAPPTLQDLEKQQNELGQPAPPAGGSPRPFLPDSRQPTPSGSSQPGIATPNSGPPQASPPSSVPGAGPTGPIQQTPGGPAIGTRGQGTIDTPTNSGASPAAGSRNGSIVVPNGNGTSTVIAPDGSISTIPTPK